MQSADVHEGLGLLLPIFADSIDVVLAHDPCELTRVAINRKVKDFMKTQEVRPVGHKLSEVLWLEPDTTSFRGVGVYVNPDDDGHHNHVEVEIVVV
jgi:hypothetical protein